MKTNIKQLISLFIFTFFAMSDNAFATVNNHYHGSFCKAYYGSDSNLVTPGHTGLSNNTNSTLAVSCPILRASMRSVNGGTDKAWVNWTGKGKITCFLNSTSPAGYAVQTKIGSRNGSGWFYIPGITYVDVSNTGAYSMTCNLPPYGKLNTIIMREK